MEETFKVPSLHIKLNIIRKGRFLSQSIVILLASFVDATVICTSNVAVVSCEKIKASTTLSPVP